MSEAKKEALIIQKEGLTNSVKPLQQYNEPSVLPKLGKTDTPHNTQKKIAEEVELGHSTIGRVIEFQNRIFRTYYKKDKSDKSDTL
jgi:hypothetical protein